MARISGLNPEFLPDELIVVLLSALPIIELRGGIPLGIAVYHMDAWKAFILASIGNLIPVVPLLLLLDPISNWLAQKVRAAAVFQNWLFEKTRQKHSEKIDRLGAVGLFLFVAIPAPGTGAWTGALIAFLFNIRFAYALPAIVAGVIVAGAIVTVASVGAVALANTLGWVLLAIAALFVAVGVVFRRRIKAAKTVDSGS